MQQVTGVLVVQNGKYVVQKRDNIPTISEPGKHSLWGGAAEDDETPLQTACRELFEETGVQSPPDAFIHLTSYETASKSPRHKGKPVAVHLYAVELNDETFINCYEGEKLVRISGLADLQGDEVTEFLVKAVCLYEQ